MEIKYYSASWCGPCKTFYPVVESVCKELDIKLIKIDVEDPDVIIPEGVRAVPTTIISDGTRFTGVVPNFKEELLKIKGAL